jgi:hypothetical protein
MVTVFLFVPSKHPGPPVSAPLPAQVVSTDNPGGELAPSLANYQIVANRSLDELDELLTRQAHHPQPRAPIYTASAFVLVSSPD